MKAVIRTLFRRRTVVGLAGAGALAVGALLAVPQLRWRTHLLALQLIGRIPDIELTQTLAYMWPGAEQSIESLRRTRNPFEVIRNYRTTPADIRAGAVLFRERGCATCHGGDASGGPGGPPLAGGRVVGGTSDWAIYRTIASGVPNTAMPAHELPDRDLWQIVSYIRYVSAPPEAGFADTANGVGRRVSVSYEDIAGTRTPADDWLTFGGAYSSWRHSALTQLTRENVDRLALRWARQFPGRTGGIEASPVVRGGVMFFTVPPSTAIAVDAASGQPIWEYAHTLRVKESFGDYQPKNRGVAILGDKVFFGTRDAMVVALSASTGAVVWERVLSDNPGRYFVSSAPLAVRDMIIVGVGTRQGGRGFVVALDANTGAERWRFTSIPGEGEPGNETWAGESWRDGGGPMWMSGSYDVANDLLIWGVGNPKPDYDKSVRAGDNLHTNSAVALRGTTGELVWHFQFTPGDDHDWDSAQAPILVDGPDGTGRVLWANRNGHYYVLDRATGRFLAGVPFVQQTWNEGLDSTGRPILRADSLRARLGSMVYPGQVGGTNWWPPSYDPERKLIFVPALEQGMAFFSSTDSWPMPQGGQAFYTAIRALDPLTGARVWEHRYAPRLVENKTAGLLSTASGLLFGGDMSTFSAFDSRTGTLVWSVDIGGLIMAAPMTYAVNGTQYVAIAAGESVFAFALPRSALPRSTVRD